MERQHFYAYQMCNKFNKAKNNLNTGSILINTFKRIITYFVRVKYHCIVDFMFYCFGFNQMSKLVHNFNLTKLLIQH